MTSKVLQKSLFLAAAAGVTATSATAAVYYNLPERHKAGPQKKMPAAYEATFSVPIECESCTNDISNALSKLPGVQETRFSIPSKMVTTRSTEPPSKIIAAIQSTGRAAILRGSGKANSAAVCILETPVSPHSSSSIESAAQASPVRGLVRLIELGERMTLLDLALSGMKQGRYAASLRTNGDISGGKKGMGSTFAGLDGKKNGEVGEVVVDSSGQGSLVGEIDWQIWEMIGRGIVVEHVASSGQERVSASDSQDSNVVLGVIARSAGTWENDKSVCSCTGKTVWEEREQMVGKGML